MEFIYKMSNWQNAGEAPSDELQERGFQPGQRPPAPTFNWQWHQSSHSITELQEKLSDEEAARIDGDSNITNNLDTERNERISGDNALREQISNEVTARANGDSALDSKISAEATTRANADSTLDGKISAEATTRGNEDNAIRQLIFNESTARANGDSSLDTKISNEATARTNEDKAIRELISKEATDRASEDSSIRATLNNKVDKVNGKGLSTNDFTDSLLDKLNGIEAGAVNYTLPKATSGALGGVKIGYAENNQNYPVELNADGQMFVNVPWTDSTGANTTYTLSKDGSTIKLTGSDGTSTAVSDSDSNTTYSLTKNGSDIVLTGSDGTSTSVTVASSDTNTTYTLTKTGSTISLTGSDGSTTSVTDSDTDTNTTYTLTKSGSTITLAGSDGTTTSVEDSDTNTNTTYTLSKADGKITLTGSDGSETTVLDTGVGMSVEGYTYSDGTAGGTGAEVFNNYPTVDGTTLTGGNIASGRYSLAMGKDTTASGSCSAAVGFTAKALEDYAVAIGYFTESNFGSTSMGYVSKATGGYATAMGCHTTASGNYSTAMGHYTTAQNHQFVAGFYNVLTDGPTSMSDTTGSLLLVGNGSGSSARSNAFRISTDGTVYGVGAFRTSGADYSEFFEWADGNPNNEDRRGYFVTLDGEKIRKATTEDDYILGVVSATPSVTGDTQSETWQGQYLKDSFGARLTETVETVNEKGETVTETRWILNPEYDPTQDYVRREDRKEWAAVGLFGKLVVVDDGSCIVNRYCAVGADGRATLSDNGYRVMARIDENHVKIMLL